VSGWLDAPRGWFDSFGEIVRFGLPAAGNNSLMPPGFYWLRAAMMSNIAVSGTVRMTCEPAPTSEMTACGTPARNRI